MSAGSVAQDQIKAFVERIERLEEERASIAKDIGEVYAEAKGNGFDRKALKIVVTRRRQDHNERMELEALVELYEAALMGRSADDYEEVGTRVATRARAPATRKDTPDHDAETGEIIEPDEPQPPPEATVNPAAHIETPAEESSLAQEPSEPEGSGGMQDELTIHPPTHSEPAAVSNVTPLRTHDPATHFLNSKGLARLHGCQGPEACASSQPRSKLCFACSVAHDGPVASEASA